MRKGLIFVNIIIGSAFLLASCGSGKSSSDGVVELQKNSPNKRRQPIREIYLKGGKTGIMVIHGYAASSLTMNPMASALNQCGYTVYCVLLPGHGTDIKDLDNVRKEDYYKYIDKAYKKFTKKVDRVFVVGHSLGSLLTVYLSSKYKLDGVVLVSPPFLVLKEGMNEEEIHEAALTLGRVFRTLPRANPTYLKNPDYFKKYGIYSGFSSKSLEVLAGVILDTRKKLADVDAPILIISGSYDPLVDYRTADYIFNEVKSMEKKKIIIESVGHRFFLGEKMPVIVKEIALFIESVQKAKQGLLKSY